MARRPADKTTAAAKRRRPTDEQSTASQRELLLVTMAGMGVGTVHPLPRRPVVVIGRDDGADIQVVDDGASRRHAALRYEAATEEFILSDLDSRNGTWLNGERCHTDHPVKAGDIIELGLKLTLRVTRSDEIEAFYAKEMYQAVLRDGLTGVYNRRYLEERLVEEVAFATRHNAPLSMLMMDIDRFRSINDEHGHPAGDAVLRRLGHLLTTGIRTEDVVVRYGGEEFAVVCRGIDQGQAAILAERLRRTIANEVFDYEGTSMLITVSIGVAGLHESDATTPAELVAAADQGLCRAKEGGRNRWCHPE